MYVTIHTKSHLIQCSCILLNLGRLVHGSLNRGEGWAQAGPRQPLPPPPPPPQQWCVEQRPENVTGKASSWCHWIRAFISQHKCIGENTSSLFVHLYWMHIMANSGIISHLDRNKTKLTLVMALFTIWVRKYLAETFHGNTIMRSVRWWWRNTIQLWCHIPFNYLHNIRPVSCKLICIDDIVVQYHVLIGSRWLQTVSIQFKENNNRVMYTLCGLRCNIFII